MKKISISFLLVTITLFTFAQSVTLEPGKSVFNQNTTESVEIKSTSVFPLTIRSTQPASGLPFYSNTNMFRGHIQGGVGGMIYSTPANHGHSFWTKNQQRVVIDSVGNIGIGEIVPRFKLNVFETTTSLIDTLAFFNSSSSYSSLFASPSFRVVFGNNGYISARSQGESKRLAMHSDGELELSFLTNFTIGSSRKALLVNNEDKVLINPVPIGFSSFFPARADLDVNGTLRSSELKFTENSASERRPVFADKDGILRIESSSNHYASYNFSSVFPQNSLDEYTKGSGYAWFNTTSGQKTFYLPINLPDGVKITNVRMFLLDNSTSNLAFNFNKNSHLSNTFTTIASAQSSTSTANLFSITDNANETVDNQNNSYYVNISSSGNWTGNTLQFHSLVITYQYQ